MMLGAGRQRFTFGCVAEKNKIQREAVQDILFAPQIPGYRAAHVIHDEIVYEKEPEHDA